MEKRVDKINYYLDIAKSVAQRSTCLRKRAGAVIVNNDEIISTGYNGAPRGRINCIDLGYCIKKKMFPEIRHGGYDACRSVHAEQNAILNARGKSLEGCRIYVNLFPCHDCARNIIQSGIKTVCYLEDKYADTDSIKASKYMFEKAKVKLIQLTPQVDKIEINFTKK